MSKDIVITVSVILLTVAGVIAIPVGINYAIGIREVEEVGYSLVRGYLADHPHELEPLVSECFEDGVITVTELHRITCAKDELGRDWKRSRIADALLKARRERQAENWFFGLSPEEASRAKSILKQHGIEIPETRDIPTNE